MSFCKFYKITGRTDRRQHAYFGQYFVTHKLCSVYKFKLISSMSQEKRKEGFISLYFSLFQTFFSECDFQFRTAVCVCFCLSVHNYSSLNNCSIKIILYMTGQLTLSAGWLDPLGRVSHLRKIHKLSHKLGALGGLPQPGQTCLFEGRSNAATSNRKWLILLKHSMM